MKNGQEYRQFLSRKGLSSANYGFDPMWLPEFLFGFQSTLVDWCIRKGRAAVFADCGL